MFNCPPDVARRQSWRDVQAILDYRNAKTAIDLFNGGSKGLEELAKHPELTDLLLALCRAQAGDETLTREQAFDGMAANRPDRDDDEES